MISSEFSSPAGQDRGSAGSAQGRPADPGAPSKIAAVFDLTPMQAGMLYDLVTTPRKGMYQLNQVVRLTGAIDEDLIERSFQRLVDRHEAARTVIVHQGLPAPKQVVMVKRRAAFSVTDLRASTGQGSDEVFRALCAEEIDRPFNLERDSLLRLRLVRLGDDEAALIWTAHHLVIDGWSFGKLLTDYGLIYRALAEGGEELPEPPSVTMRDYVSWLKSQGTTTSHDYWADLLDGTMEPPALLPACAPGGPGKIRRRVDPAVWGRATAQATRIGATAAALIETAWALTLARHTGGDDIVIGHIVSGRESGLPGIETMIGSLTNTVPLRVTLVDGDTVAGLVARVSAQAIASSRHSWYSLPEILRLSGCGSALMPSMVAIENHLTDFDQSADALPGLTSRIEAPTSFLTNDLTLMVVPAADGTETIDLDLLYDPSLYSGDDAARWLDRLVVALAVFADDPDHPVATLDLLDEAERETIRRHFNDTGVAWNETSTVVDLIEATTAADPTAIALIAGGVAYTRGEILAAAEQVAARLAAHGAGPGETVGLAAVRGVELVVGLLGILCSGSAYVPLDPAYPRARLDEIIADCAPKALVTAGMEADWACQDWGIPLVDLTGATRRDASGQGLRLAILDEESAADTGEAPIDQDTVTAATAPIRRPAPGDAAYIIFTSGSTGRPKGVVVEHRNLVNYCSTPQIRAALGVDDVDDAGETRLVSVTNYSFDIFGTESWAALALGVPVILASEREIEDPAAFARLVASQEATCLQTTPSMMTHLLSGSDQTWLGRMRTFMIGGEAMPEALVRRLQESSSARVTNVYGPTETTVWSTGREITDPQRIDVGRPFSNQRVHILSGTTQLGIGMPGELCIAGAGVSRGYLHCPELTAERFIDDPNGLGRLYRTGDRARWLPDGTIDVLGRFDDQVKIRGRRIELGEIEAALLACPAVREAVAVVDGQGDAALLDAYCVLEEPIAPGDLRARLADLLPAPVIPSRIIPLPAIPLTRSGKIDRVALARLGRTMAASDPLADPVAPPSPLEALVAEVFTEVLGVAPVAGDDDFFLLGGHSLTAMQAVNRLEARTGIRLDLRVFFNAPTPSDIARAISARIETAAAAATATPAGDREATEPVGSIPSTGGAGDYPMSPAQRRLFTIEAFGGAGTAYSMPAVVALDPAADPVEIEGLVNRLIRRHEALRTSFHDLDGHLVQRVHPDRPIRVELYRLAEGEPVEGAMERFVRPFDLAADPLVRLGVARGPQGSYLLLDLHHIITDATSTAVIVAEFDALRRGEDLEPVAVQAKDWAAWLAERDDTADRDYWIDRFTPAPAPLDLVTDRPRPPVTDFAGAVVRIPIDRAIRDAVARLAHDHEATEFMVILAALMVVLSRHGRSEDVVVGAPTAGRVDAAVARTVGLFVETVAVRQSLDSARSFTDLLERVRGACLDAFAHQLFPFDSLVEALPITRDPARNPLFDVMFSLQNAEAASDRLEGISEGAQEYDPGIARFDLTIDLTPLADEGYRCEVIYRTVLFDADSVERIIRHLVALVEDAAHDPTRPIGQLTMIDDGERAALARWNETDVPFDRAETLAGLLEKTIARLPDHVALDDGVERLTYEQWCRRAARIARVLVGAGIKPGERVGIAVPHSAAWYVAWLGVVLTGGAWIPLDPAHPAARNRLIIDDADPRVILVAGSANGVTTAPAPRSASAAGSGVDSWAVEAGARPRVIDLGCDEIVQAEPWDQPCPAQADDIAYLIYTSGTTGRPKGVMLGHSGLVNLATVLASTGGAGPQSVVLGYANPVFDGSVWNWLQAFSCGATLRIVPPDLVTDVTWLNALISSGEITHATLPPTIACRLEKPHLDWICEAGSEAAPLTFDGAFTNGYGPTETTVCSTLWDKPVGDPFPSPIPIGRPRANARVHIVTTDLALAGIGVPGEICVSGAGLAFGYLGQEDLTAERFVDNPFGSGRLYRTGDLGRWREDGQIEFLGRVDTQVKIHGMRIETAEIEAIIRQVVRDAVVIARTVEGDEILHAYYVTDDPDPGVEAMLAHLEDHLPRAMIPARWLRLNAIPLTTSGKTDVAALPPIAAPRSRATGELSAAEKRVAEAFAAGLNSGPVGADDDFFALGGDSISAIRVVAAARRAGWTLDAATLMRHRSPRALAALLGDALVSPRATEDPALSGAPGPEPESSVEPEKRSRLTFGGAQPGDEPTEFPPTPVQRRFLQAGLAAPHHLNQSVFLRSAQRFDIAQLVRALDAVVALHPAIRIVVAEGGLRVLPVGEGPQVVLDVHTWDGFDPTRIEAIDEVAQTSFDLAHGPLLTAVLHRLPEADHLLLVAHHLAIDAVSWPILTGDLLRAYEGRALLPATISPAQWNTTLAQRAAAGEFDDQATYWRDIVAKAVSAPSPFTRETTAAASPGASPDLSSSGERNEPSHRRIDADLTDRLLTDLPRRLDVEAVDIVHALVAATVGRLTGGDAVAFELEGHGRAGDGLDRSIGWFTVAFPFVVPLADSPGDLVAAARRERLRVPDGGLAYGYLASEERSRLQACHPSLGVNYLGRIDSGPPGSPVTLSTLPGGSTMDRRDHFGAPVTLNLSVCAGVLEIAVAADLSVVDRAVVEGFLDALLETVEIFTGDEISRPRPADHADHAEDGVFPSDKLEPGEWEEISALFE
ncbi:MAG: amino acid adenylation domain-containing protein [Propionibacteriaceae bacterium]|jgi:amino acid adenylation domain-containing protein|nr:amino acid adenylation domain-containing protein [Propionibacteriaceae bacterium]